MIKRRNFLISCAIGTTALTTPLGWAAAGNSTNSGLTKDKFQSLLHHNFRCMDEKTGMINMDLVEIREGPQVPGLEQFSLVFQERNSSGKSHLQDGLYQLYHPETGRALIHLAPSNTEAGRYTTYFGLFT